MYIKRTTETYRGYVTQHACLHDCISFGGRTINVWRVIDGDESKVWSVSEVMSEEWEESCPREWGAACVAAEKAEAKRLDRQKRRSDVEEYGIDAGTIGWLGRVTTL